MSIFRKNIRKKRIGLALGGGAVLGAFHIGALKAFEERDIQVSYVSGTSIGAFIAAFYAFGKGSAEIEQFARELHWFDVSGLSVSKLGLLSNKKMGSLIREHLGDVRIEDAEIPLAIVATDISSGEKVILREGSVAEAVMASTCIPGIFIPVEMEGRLLVDGGIVENLPVTPLVGMGAEYIVAIELFTQHKSKRPEHIVEVLLRSFSYLLRSANKAQLKKIDLFIKPDLSAFNVLHTDQVAELMEVGYKETKKLLAGKL